MEAGLTVNQVSLRLIRLTVETRSLPAAVVREEVELRAQKQEEAQGYPVGRKGLRELKERVTEELLPRAFTRKSNLLAWIDPVNHRVVVDGLPTKAEGLLEHLRQCLDELPLALIQTQVSAVAGMSDWLAGDAPAGFTVDRDCELRAPDEEKAAVRYVRHPLEGDDIKEHLTAGKLPTRLALTWDDRLSFILAEDGSIRRLAFLDVIKEQAQDAADKVELFDAEFALMTGELQRFIPAIFDALGGQIKDLPEN